jgi:uncharacterized membrane protein YeaQ/YmgE (transglycosylase-associated protein family)
MFGAVIGSLFIAFVTGALARFALPGPDPMPLWLTIAIGLVGSAVGYGIVYGVLGERSWAGVVSFGTAVVLVVLYRRFVQKRPLWGKDAYRFPERGFGVEQYRERLKRAGIDPDQIGTQQQFGVLQPRPPLQQPVAAGHARSGDAPTENPAHYLGLLEELHDTGVLEDDEYTAARMRLLESLRA